MYHATPPERVYSMDALMAEGFSRRAIYGYIAGKVIPGANGRGPTAYYTDEHIRRLREIKAHHDSKRTLADLREDFESRRCQAPVRHAHQID